MAKKRRGLWHADFYQTANELKVVNPKPTDFQRFFALLEVVEEQFEGSNCWQWIGSIDKKGYGQFKWKGKTEQSHRWSHAAFKGQVILAGNEVHHRCENKRCVNPLHTEQLDPLGHHVEHGMEPMTDDLPI